MNQVTVVLCLLVLSLTLNLNVGWSVEGLSSTSYQNNIIAGGVLDPITNGVDATNLRLKFPVGGCANPSTGDLFLCDHDERTQSSSGFNRIFKVDAKNKTVSVYAGNGLDQTGSGDGFEAIYAGLKPLTCTCDMNGDLYILDGNNNNIRMVNGTTHIITLFADGASLDLSSPNSLASDDTYVYVTDIIKIRKIHKTTKVVSDLAGGGQEYTEGALATSVSLSRPSGVDLDGEGSIYFCDTGSYTVKKVKPDGNIVTVAGNGQECENLNKDPCGDGGQANSSQLLAPTFVHVTQDGHLIISDYGRIRSVDLSTGVIDTLAGTGESGVSKTGGTDGDGSLTPKTVILQTTANQGEASIHGLFGFNNVIYFNDKFARRYRKIENGIVDHAFGGSISSNLHFGGLSLANSYFGTTSISLAFDSDDNLYLGTNNGVFKSIKMSNGLPGLTVRLAGGEEGNYANNVSALHAQFGTNLKIVVTKTKDIYIADKENHSVLKYDSVTKMVTRIVGTGTARSPSSDAITEGAGETVALFKPTICLDMDENVIILDYGGYLARWDNQTGMVTRLASSTTITTPQACVTDAAKGDIYWSEPNVIKVLKVSGTVETYAGGVGICPCGYENGAASSTKLSTQLNDLFIVPLFEESGASTMYWSEVDPEKTSYAGIRFAMVGGSSIVHSLTDTMRWYPFFPSMDDIFEGQRMLTDRLLLKPNALSLNSKKIPFFTDGSTQGFIRYIDDLGVNTAAGHYDIKNDLIYYNGEQMPATETVLCNPTTVIRRPGSTVYFVGVTCIDGAENKYGVGAVTSYSRVLKIENGITSTVVGNFLDRHMNDDEFRGAFQPVRPLKADAGVFYPFGIAIDSTGNNLYFSDSIENRVRMVQLENGFILDVPATGLNSPTGIFLASDGTLYIADTFNHKIKKYADYELHDVAGSGTECTPAGDASCDDSNPTNAKLSYPSNIYVTASGDVYFTDAGNSKVRKIKNGVMSVVAGSGAACSDSDCGHNIDPTQAKLNQPMGIWVDESTDDVYLTDQTYTIRKVSQSLNRIYTVAGSFGKKLYSGSSSNIYFNSPTGIILTSDGIVVADTGNGMIRNIKLECKTGFTGLSCNTPTCFGLSPTDANICSGNGSCVDLDTCSCKKGFDGSKCDIVSCNGIHADNPAICSGNGTCVLGDCNCNRGYYGIHCNETIVCSGIYDIDPLVCSGHGSCVSNENCSCNTGFIGSNCETEIHCFGISFNDSTVCSGYGTCSQMDNCDCVAGYSGSRCNVSTHCYGILNINPTVCSGHGNCTGEDQCSCNYGLSGSTCNVKMCFDVNSTSPSVCSGYGNCTDIDTCVCVDGYHGVNCNISTHCFGVLDVNPQVCSGQGNCIGQDSCSCNAGYRGASCNTSTHCFGVLDVNPQVCGGHGDCLSEDSCSCKEGWSGRSCSFKSCFGVNETSPSVCSGYGNCTDIDTCACVDGYHGVNCNISTHCFGVLDVNPQVCSGQGNCIGQDSCTCNAGYYGASCNISTQCFGILDIDPQVCGGHGNCTGQNQCACETDWKGSNCIQSAHEPISCAGVLSSDALVCSGHGNCSSLNNCTCHVGYSGDNCNVDNSNPGNNNNNSTPTNNTNSTNNNGTNANNGTDNGNSSGNSTNPTNNNNSTNNSTDNNNNTGNNNNNSTNNGTDNNNNNGNNNNTTNTNNGTDNSNTTNSNNGTNNTDNNNNNGTNNTDNGTNNTNNGTNNGNTTNSNNGTNNTDNNGTNNSTNNNTNNTDNGNNSGNSTNPTNNNNSTNNSTDNNTGNNNGTTVTTYCFGVRSNESSVCSGHGVCSQTDKCTCSTGWSGASCNTALFTCYGILETDASACSGHGVCIDLDVCKCDTGYVGPSCGSPNNNNNGTTAPVTCFGIIFNESSVCSGHGVCSSLDKCTCSSGYSGEKCNTPTNTPSITCFGIDQNDTKVCSGHGSCSTKDSCSCSTGWSGLECDTPNTPQTITCFGISDKDSQVCSAHGSCVGQDKCSCSQTWSGPHCYVTTCSGISSLDISVCNGKGSCINFDTCSCIPGWSGATCSVTSCFSVLSSDSKVCNGHGTCSSPDSCKCQQHYEGFNCNITSCQGISSLDQSVCGQNGICQTFDSCTCTSGWFGKYCNETSTTCFGLNDKDATVCSGHGSCIQKDQCSCSTDFFGSDCSDEVPQIKISGSDTIAIQVDRTPITVKQYLTCSQCNLNATMSSVSIDWKQISGPTTSFTKLATNDLKIVSFTDESSQQYVFEVSSTYKNNIRKAQVTITTQEVEFGILIYQSDLNSTHVTVGVEFSPETMVTKLSTATWTWNCKNADLATTCDQSIMNDLANYASKRSTLFTLAAGSSKSIYLTLQIRKTTGDLTVSFPKDTTVPIVNLLSASPQKTIFTTSEKLTLQLIISVNGKYDGIESLIQREWTLNGKLLSSPILSSPTTDVSKSNLVVIDISKLSEGSSNNLTCQVTSVASKSSSTYTYAFTVAVNPKPCQCSSSPATGYAFETQFTITCTNCPTSSDTNLQFSFTDAKTKLKVPLATSTSTKFVTILPYTGSTTLPIQCTLTNIKTKAKVENLLNVTVLLPMVKSRDEIKKKKTSWDAIYKTLSSADPRKTVYGYITTTVGAMSTNFNGKRSILDETCYNGGVYIPETKICNCTEGFKKNDCSMTISDWLELVNDRWLTAKLVYEEFKAANQEDSASDSSLTIQSSILYHLIEKYDEISPEQFNGGVDIFKQQIQDTKSTSYVTIPTTLSDAMSSTLGLLQKSQLAIDGKKSDVFDQVIMECLTDLGSIKSRDQPVGDLVSFESDSYTLTTIKFYPTELSNKKIGELFQFPDLMTNYLTGFDIRKSLSISVWKQLYNAMSNKTTETSNGVETIVTFTSIGYTLSLDMGVYGQSLTIPQGEKIMSYFFQVNMVPDSSITETIGNKMKITNTSSTMMCDSDCLTEQVETNVYVCKCGKVSQVSMIERKITQVSYSDIQLPIVREGGGGNNYGYLAFLSVIPIIAIIILVPIGVVKYLRQKKIDQQNDKSALELKIV